MIFNIFYILSIGWGYILPDRILDMYHHSSHYGKNKGFPWIMIVIAFLFFSFARGIPFYFLIIFIFAGFRVLTRLLSSGNNQYHGRRTTYQSLRSHQVPVSYVDEVPDYENPENFNTKMIFCMECGQKVDHIAKFCSFCGTSLLN